MTDGVNLGSAYAEIDLDTTPLQRGVRDVQRPLRKLDQSIERTGKTADRSSRLLDLPARSLDKVGQSADRAVRNLRRSNESLRNTGDAAQRAQQPIGGLRSGVSGLTGTVGALGGAFAAARVIQFGKDALGAANDLEKTQASVRALAGDQATYNEILRLADDQQRRYGGTLAENIAQLGSLANSARNAGIGIGDINSAAQRLLILDPAAQFQDASIALREALSGDITSLAERFELSRKELAALSDESLSGAEKMEVLDGILNDLGATTEAVEAASNTTAATYSNLAAETEQLTTRLGGLLQRGLEPAAVGLSRVTAGASDAIDTMEYATRSTGDLVNELQAGTDGMMAFTEAQQAFRSSSEEVQNAYQQEGVALRTLQQEHRAAIERVYELATSHGVQSDAYQDALDEANRIGNDLERQSDDLTSRMIADEERVVEARERAAEKQRAIAQAAERQAIQAEIAAGNTAEAINLIADSATQSEDAINDATAAIERMADVEQDILSTQEALTDVDAEYAQTRKNTLQDLADAEEDYQQRLASIAADENGAIQEAYEERNETITDTQRGLGETLTDISADTNRKLAEMAEEGARQEAEARRRVEQQIAGTLADTRVSAEVNDLSAVGAAPEDRAGIEQRERTEARRLEALQAAQQEALRFTQQGEAELAGEQFGIRERGIEDRLALEESYEEQRQRLIEQGRSDLIGELDRERDEALTAIQEREDLAIRIAHEAAQQRQRQRQEERQAIIEEGNIRKAAAREAAQEQIAAAEQAAERQVAAARESAAIQRQEAQARIAEEREELAQQAAQELVSYEERRGQLEATLNEQLVAYGQYYGKALTLNEQEQQKLTERLNSEYDIQEQELHKSLQRRLDATRAYAEEQANVQAQRQIEEAAVEGAMGVRDFATGAAEQATQAQQTLAQPRAIGGPVRAGDVYTVGETGRELFMPGQNGRIIPNRMTENILAGMQRSAAPMARDGGGIGGITINISNPVVDNTARLQEMAGMIGSKVQSAVWGQFGAALDDLAAQGVP